MLTFSKRGLNYLITETTHSATATHVKTVEYFLDLSKKRCNDEPFADTNEADRAWFEKHYRHKFTLPVRKCVCGQLPSCHHRGFVTCTNARCLRKPAVTRESLEIANEAWNNLIEILALKETIEDLESQNESLRLDLEHGVDRVR